VPIPYRKTPRAAEYGLAAYIDVVWLELDRVFCGAVLIVDGKGQPQEFVHNSASAPSGILWPEDKVRANGVALVVHSLFDASRRDADLLVCMPTLGTPEYCLSEIAPSIPFVQVVPEQPGIPAEWSWINSQPTAGMRAAILAAELARRGFVTEPFERLHDGLRVVYPNATWPHAGVL